MRQMLGLLAATALVGLASTASADELTGPIKQIDRVGNTFVVGKTLFAAAPYNTVGPKLADLKPGDRVTVFYEAESSYSRRPLDAMVLKEHG
jgi:hypothetical protein